MSKVVATHSPGKKARDLFVDHPQDFAIHQPSEQTEIYISLFEGMAPAVVKTVIPQDSESHQNGKQSNFQPAPTPPSTQGLVTFKSRSQLETAIVQLVSSLIANSPDGVTDLSAIASQFHVRYRQPITGVISELQIKQRFPTFLKSCESLLVEQKGKAWQVRLRAR
ncbi:MAG: hypothetical protein IGS48_14705 [Oscillatoriales cyanobacterium C42_A2020_001]|nr:hypothetical protein [Leptolyngbyaceae cyanobacterium C42_A2020_001]